MTISQGQLEERSITNLMERFLKSLKKEPLIYGAEILLGHQPKHKLTSPFFICTTWLELCLISPICRVSEAESLESHPTTFSNMLLAIGNNMPDDLYHVFTPSG